MSKSPNVENDEQNRCEEDSSCSVSPPASSTQEDTHLKTSMLEERTRSGTEEPSSLVFINRDRRAEERTESGNSRPIKIILPAARAPNSSFSRTCTDVRKNTQVDIPRGIDTTGFSGRECESPKNPPRGREGGKVSSNGDTPRTFLESSCVRHDFDIDRTDDSASKFPAVFSAEGSQKVSWNASMTDAKMAPRSSKAQEQNHDDQVFGDKELKKPSSVTEQVLCSLTPADEASFAVGSGESAQGDVTSSDNSEMSPMARTLDSSEEMQLQPEIQEQQPQDHQRQYRQEQAQSEEISAPDSSSETSNADTEYQQSDTPTSNSTKRRSSKKTSLLPGQTAGRWTKAEHEAFLAGLKIHGREWKKVAEYIPTRNSAQIRSHAQKYFAKLAREESLNEHAVHQVYPTASGSVAGTESGVGVGSVSQGINGVAVSNPSAAAGSQSVGRTAPTLVDIPPPLPPSVLQRAARIMSDPTGAQREVDEAMRALRERYRLLQIQLQQNQRRRYDLGAGLVGGGSVSRIVEDEDENSGDDVGASEASSSAQSTQLQEQSPREQMEAQQPPRHAPRIGPATAALEQEQRSQAETEDARRKRNRHYDSVESPALSPAAYAVAISPPSQYNATAPGPADDAVSISSSCSYSVAASLASMSPHRELGSEELIALHVLGGELPHSASREDFLSGMQHHRHGVGNGTASGVASTGTSSISPEEQGHERESVDESSSVESGGSKKRKMSHEEEDGNEGGDNAYGFNGGSLPHGSP